MWVNSIFKPKYKKQRDRYIWTSLLLYIVGYPLLLTLAVLNDNIVLFVSAWVSAFTGVILHFLGCVSWARYKGRSEYWVLLTFVIGIFILIVLAMLRDELLDYDDITDEEIGDENERSEEIDKEFEELSNELYRLKGKKKN
jgi:hypothetical protein